MLTRLPTEQLEAERKLVHERFFNDQTGSPRPSQGDFCTRYIFDLDDYPGVHISAPFHAMKPRGDTLVKEERKKILPLAKLNLNTADFCSGLPITIGFASKVGRILREFDGNEGYGPESGYRFYV